MTIKKLSTGPWEGIAYREAGAGTPVMLVHGVPADGRLWKQQMPALSARCRLLVPDLPGSGASPIGGPLTIEDMAEVIAAILDAEGVGSCILIGHSMGGYATLAFAEKYPSRLQAFGLFHSTASADSPERKEGRLRSIRLMECHGSTRFFRQTLPGLFTQAYRKAHPEVLRELVERASEAPASAMAHYYEAMRIRPNRSAVLTAARVPVLFVIGGQDTAAPPADVLRQVSLPAVSQVHLWSDVAHMGMLETPERATEVLDGFIRFVERIFSNQP